MISDCRFQIGQSPRSQSRQRLDVFNRQSSIANRQSSMVVADLAKRLDVSLASVPYPLSVVDEATSPDCLARTPWPSTNPPHSRLLPAPLLSNGLIASSTTGAGAQPPPKSSFPGVLGRNCIASRLVAAYKNFAIGYRQQKLFPRIRLFA
jgi:hypothetical protein